MQRALHGKIKERKSEWLIGANTQNVLCLSIVATQHITRQRRVRRVSIMGKARRREGAQGPQFSRLLKEILSSSLYTKNKNGKKS